MSDKSKIEWTEASWNVLAGCSKVSAGCKNCYAIPHAHRMAGNPNEKIAAKYEGTTTDDGKNWTGRINFAEHTLDQPLRWTRPRRIFVNSMSDLFHEDANEEDVRRIFAVMMCAPQHTFQILTKRPAQMLEFFKRNSPNDCYTEAVTELMLETETSRLISTLRSKDRFDSLASVWPLKNVWLGVSVENQQTADERIPLLLQTPAAVRWLSCEPLLGAVDLSKWLATPVVCASSSITDATALALKGLAQAAARHAGWCTLDWVVCGGESGNGARPSHPDWFRSLRDQCAAAGVPYFFKQHGAWLEVEADSPTCQVIFHGIGEQLPKAENYCFVATDGEVVRRREEMCDDVPYRWMKNVGKHAAGRLLDGREHNEFPEVRA